MDAFYEDSMHLAVQYQRRFFLKQELHVAPYMLTYQDEMNNRNREHAIDASYPVSVHLAKRFQWRRFFRNRPI